MRDFDGLKILVLEDSKVDYLVLERMLLDLGIEKEQLHWFTTLKEINVHPYDLAICDLNLPDSDRMETIGRVKNKLGHVPLIALTVTSALDLAIKTIQEGAQDFLVKGSFDKLQLFKAINFALERQEYRQKLLQSKQEFENIFEHNPLPHLVYNPLDLNILKVNQAASKLYDYSKEELLSMALPDILPDSPAKNSILDQFIKGDYFASETSVHLTKKKQLIHVEITLQAFPGKDENEVVLAIKNITQQVKAKEILKRSELRFEYATRATSDIIYDWDLSTNKLEWKGKSIKKFYKNNGPTNIQQWIKRIHPEDKSAFIDFTSTIFNEKHANREIEKEIRYRLSDKNDKYIHVQDRCIIIIDDLGNPERIIGAIEDITDKVKIQKDLAISEKRYNVLFNESPQPKFLCKTKNLFIQQTNKEGLKLLEQSGEDIQFFHQFFKGQKLNDFQNKIYNDKSKSDHCIGVWTFPTVELNKKVAIQITVNSIELGGEDLILFACTNVTELEEAKTSLEYYINRYQLVLKATKEAIWDLNLLNNQLNWGDNFNTLFGYDSNMEEGVGAWQSKIHKDDRNSIIDSFERAINGEEKTWEADYRFQKADGNYAHVFNQCVFVRDKRGKALQAVGAIQDVTKQKSREHQLKLMERVMYSANDPILITEAEQISKPGPIIIYANDAFFKQTGYSREEILGKSPRILQGPKTDRKELDRLRRSIQNFEPCQVEVINYKKTGEEFWVEFSVVPVADESGWFTHWISIQRETTVRNKRDEINQVFHNMLLAVNQSENLIERFEAVLNEILDYTGLEVAEGWMTNMDSGKLYKVTGFTNFVEFNEFCQILEDFEEVERGIGLTGSAWEKGEIIIWEDLEDHPYFIHKKEVKKYGFKNAIAIPLHHDKELVGVITLFTRKRKSAIMANETFFRKLGQRLGAEVKRLKTEDELKTVFHLIPNLLFVTNSRGIIKKGNSQLAKVFNCRDVDLMGKSFHQIIPKGYRAEFDNFLSNLIQTKTEVELDIPILVNKQITWINITASYVSTEMLIYSIGKDISKQRNLEYLMKRSQEMAQIGTWEVNLIKNSIYWSPMTKKIHEFEQSEEPNLESAINYYKAGFSRDLVQQQMNRLITGATDRLGFDAQLVTAKGNTIWVRSEGVVERLDGKLYRIYGSIQDINERKNAEKEIADVKLRYDLASKAATIGIWDWNVVEDKLVWDDTMKQLFGVELDSLTNTYQLWQNCVHPDDKESRDKEVQDALDGKKELNTQFRIVWQKTGEVRYIRAIANVLRNDAGDSVRMVGVNYDITERIIQEQKLAEIRLLQEHVINSTQDFIWSIDNDFKLILANDAYLENMQKIYGQKNELGKLISSISEDHLSVDKKRIKFWKSKYSKALAGKEQHFNFVAKGKLPESRSFEIGLYPIRDNGASKEQITGVACFSRDITDRVKHTKAIEIQNKKLRDIAWKQSHVVRAPVARLLGLTDLLKEMDYQGDKDFEEIINYIIVSTQEIDQVTRDISTDTELRKL